MKKHVDQKRSLHYAWIVVCGCVLLMFSISGIMVSIPSIFLKEVTADWGVSRTAFSLYAVFSAITGFFASAKASSFYKRFGMKRVVLFCGVLCALCVAGYGLCNGVIPFYALSALSGLGASAASTIPVSILLVNWFRNKKGLAMSLAFSGSSLGSLCAVRVFTRFLQRFGWRYTYFLMGFVMLVIVCFVVLTIIEVYPEDKGLRPYGEDLIPHETLKEQLTGITQRAFLRTPVFWGLFASIVWFPIVILGVQNNLSAYLTDGGVSLAVATNTLSFLIAVQLVGKFILGPILDRVGVSIGMVYIAGCYICGMYLMLVANGSDTTLLLAVALIGLSGGVVTIVPPYLTAEIVGQRDYAKIIGNINIAVQLGSALNTAVTNFIYDNCGGYEVAWMLYMVMMLLTCAISIVAYRKGKHFSSL